MAKSRPKRRLERIPEDLEHWIVSGGLVRTQSTDPLAGLCGAIVERNNGSDNGGWWCQRVAGYMTQHLGYGRCKHHEEQGFEFEEALPPWAGPLTDEEWKLLSGERDPRSEKHGGTYLQVIHQSWAEWLKGCIPAEEWHAYATMPTDPVEIIDQEVKLIRLEAARIRRWIQREKMVKDAMPVSVGGGQMDIPMQHAQGQLIRLAATLARLMEVRYRFSELAGKREDAGFLEEMLRDLPHEDFTRLSSSPERMLAFMTRRGD